VLLAALASSPSPGTFPRRRDQGGSLIAKFSLTGEMETEVWKYLPSFVAGGYLELKLGFVSIQPEVLYTRMGAKIEDVIEDVPFSLQYRLDYLQVPVLLKFNVVPAGPIRPFLYAGGYGGYLLKAKGIMEGGGETDEADLTECSSATTTASSAAWLAFKLPGISVSVEGRYTTALMNIIKDPVEGESAKKSPSWPWWDRLLEAGPPTKLTPVSPPPAGWGVFFCGQTLSFRMRTSR